MKVVFSIMVCLLLMQELTAQEKFTVTGTILEPTGIPAYRAEVILGKKYSVTDSTGNFKIDSVSKGTYDLVVYLSNYKKHKEKIKIDSNTQLIVSLDSIAKMLEEVLIQAKKDNDFGIGKLNNVDGTSIYAGKKSEVIYLNDLNANLATNNPRQVFSKVAGINIFENDNAGIQLGIGGRGLNPNRVSNFNTRQNGYDISADALGYPESYYTPATEALERIEVIRGAASLQYGTQFGGFINFRFKKGPLDKKMELTSRQTYGSFGLFNSFNSIGGTVKKWNYYAFYQYKQGNGWRSNSNFNMHTAHASVNYQLNSRVKLTGEYTHMTYLAKQPGGLTDKQFEKDPMQSVRDRNWFKVNWNLFAVQMDWRISDRSKINWNNFGLLAGRDALGFLGQINRPDPLTERDMLSDVYNNFGSELKFLHRYSFGKENSVFLIGARYYQGKTIRKQGLADSTDKPNFYFLHPDNLEHSSYVFPSKNIAAFTENIFQFTKKFSVTPGLRFEYINTASAGYYREQNKDLAGNIILDRTLTDNRNSTRKFLLAGIGLLHKTSKSVELYANFSQNYRSINFNDMRIVNPNFKVDPNLKDEKGFTADLGMRWCIKNLIYVDLSVFYLRYNDRIGSVIAVDSLTYVLYRLRTNISDSRNIGAECFAEMDLFKLFKKDAKHMLSYFVNASYIDAKYISSKESGFDGKKVELVPTAILRSGLTYKYKKFGVTVQGAYTSQQYSDASNSEFSTNAITGIIPSYTVFDFSTQYSFKKFTFSGGVNNFTNQIYFTRRADGYPGPGILPSDPINFYLTLQVKL